MPAVRHARVAVDFGNISCGTQPPSAVLNGMFATVQLSANQPLPHSNAEQATKGELMVYLQGPQDGRPPSFTGLSALSYCPVAGNETVAYQVTFLNITNPVDGTSPPSSACLEGKTVSTLVNHVQAALLPGWDAYYSVYVLQA